MSLPAKHNARFHRYTHGVETGNEWKRNRKRNRFHYQNPQFIRQNVDLRKRGRGRGRKRNPRFSASLFRFVSGFKSRNYSGLIA